MGGLIAGAGASMHQDAQHVWCWHARDRVQLSRHECVRVCDCADLQEQVRHQFHRLLSQE